MRSTGHWSPTEDKYDLQAVLDIEIKNLKDIVKGIDADGSGENRKEILKGMINYLVEQL